MNSESFLRSSIERPVSRPAADGVRLLGRSWRFTARATLFGIVAGLLPAAAAALLTVEQEVIPTPWWALIAALGAVLGTAVAAVTMLAEVEAERLATARALEAASWTDALTGLANRRRLTLALTAEVERTQRTGRGFAILFLDIDNLKAINDEFGHPAGTDVIVQVAQVITGCCRAVDTAARYGGDEFAVVLPESDERAAGLLGWRIRRALWGRAERRRVDVSIGVAEYPRDGSTVDMIVASADSAMYSAKAHSASRQRRSSPTAGGAR